MTWVQIFSITLNRASLGPVTFPTPPTMPHHYAHIVFTPDLTSLPSVTPSPHWLDEWGSSASSPWLLFSKHSKQVTSPSNTLHCTISCCPSPDCCTHYILTALLNLLTPSVPSPSLLSCPSVRCPSREQSKRQEAAVCSVRASHTAEVLSDTPRRGLLLSHFIYLLLDAEFRGQRCKQYIRGNQHHTQK
jgi:hypothetical protein